MEHVSLYRKYRPQSFEEVIGQRHVTNTLSNALSRGRIVHAYLFSGPRGTGKTSTARILAKALNCEKGPTASPCNECEACVSISEGTSLDVIEIDAASNRRIDEIRDLLEKIPYSPTSLRSKVYIVDEVHQLTSEASSALLKTLEEPPAHVTFVLATTEPHKLLPTIVSRCQRFDFGLVPTQDITGLLDRIASNEGVEVEEEAISLIAEHARGSVRDAISVMDQISGFTDQTVTQKQLAEILGEVETNVVLEMVNMIAERDAAGALELVGRMVEDGKDPRRFVEALVAHLRYLFLIQNAKNPEQIVEVTSDHYEKLSEQASLLRRYEVIRLVERLGGAHRDMRFSENPRLLLECALVKAIRVDADVSLEGLVYRIEQLENKIESLGRPTTSAETGPKPRAVTGKGQKDASVPRKVVEASKQEEARSEEVSKQEEIDAVGEKGPSTAVKEDDREAVESGPVERPEEVSQSPAGRKEKVRRAWVAVLAELKKEGDMRLYALLTKARIVGAGRDELVLGFPATATFQLDVLTDSQEMLGVEEELGRLMGSPMSIKLTRLEGGGKAGGGVEPRDKADVETPRRPRRTGDRQASRIEKQGDREGEEESRPGVKGDKEASVREGAEEKGNGTKDPEELARMLRDRFDGEIVEE